ncbi:MAG: hypothetical protein ACTHNW_06560 [Mucilaginibacter sp.]
MKILFFIKVAIIVVGFAIAMVNFMKYMETKQKLQLKRAAIFFFGAWLMLVLIDVVVYFLHL